MIGQTGVGKSSLSLQLATSWAIGQPCFGIVPAGKIRSLIIQAENDDGDIAEMRDGIYRGLKLTPEQQAEVSENVSVRLCDDRTGIGFVSDVLYPSAQEYCPDLIWIDPALSYLGGEANSQKDVGGFLRNMLNPVLHEMACGCILSLHTNKPARDKSRSDWSGSDYSYSGTGSAEWANWARAVLMLDGNGQVFTLRASKRGSRLRWKEADGVTPSRMRTIMHSTEGLIYWREPEQGEFVRPQTRSEGQTNPDELLKLIPFSREISESELEKAGDS